jgi:uncharacterized protein (DUF433 family)
MINEEELLDRIVVNPRIFGGKPIIRGFRMSASFLLGMMAAGATEKELLVEYEWLQPEDIRACLLYGSLLAGNERFEPRFVESERETAA